MQVLPFIAPTTKNSMRFEVYTPRVILEKLYALGLTLPLATLSPVNIEFSIRHVLTAFLAGSPVIHIRERINQE